MLVLHRRHVKDCRHQSRTYRKCACPIWLDWRIGNKRVRKPMGTSEWQVAQLRAREMEAVGITGTGAPVTVEDAFAKFIADASARELRKSTLRKHELMKRNLNAFCQNRGLIFLGQLTVDEVREFRNTWKLNARTSAKALERLRSFFKFCQESDWIEKNPAKAIKPGKVEDADVLPFDEPEVEKIVKACATFNGNGQRIRALTKLMLASGLRIGDASTISRNRFVKDGKEWKVELRTAKTGTKVYIPLQKEVVEAIEQLPGEFPFWSGESTPENCSSVWQEAYRKLFKHAGLVGHPHRFRHTFAKNLLLSGVPLETVSLLLGHRKLAITEKHYARFVPERQALIEDQVRKSWSRAGHTRKST
jgi:integrase/recombinase XerD